MTTPSPIAARPGTPLLIVGGVLTLAGLIVGLIPHTEGTMSHSCGSVLFPGSSSDSRVAACQWALTGWQTWTTLLVIAGCVFLAVGLAVTALRPSSARPSDG